MKRIKSTYISEEQEKGFSEPETRKKQEKASSYEPEIVLKQPISRTPETIIEEKISNEKFKPSLMPIGSIWTFMLVALVLGVILDIKKACTVDRQGKRKVELPVSSGAAAAEIEA